MNRHPTAMTGSDGARRDAIIRIRQRLLDALRLEARYRNVPTAVLADEILVQWLGRSARAQPPGSIRADDAAGA